MAYAAKADNKWFVVVNGNEGKQYDGLGSPLLFSPDSKRMAYAAKASNKTFIVVDGKEGNQYDAIVTPEGGRIVFDSFDSFHYLAVKGNNIYLVEEKIK